MRVRAPQTRLRDVFTKNESDYVKINRNLDVESVTRDGSPRVTREEYVQAATRTLTTVFGLRHAVDTKVGGALLRGISGGEKKRVSIAEATASRALLGAWDK